MMDESVVHDNIGSENVSEIDSQIKINKVPEQMEEEQEENNTGAPSLEEQPSTDTTMNNDSLANENTEVVESTAMEVCDAAIEPAKEDNTTEQVSESPEEQSANNKPIETLSVFEDKQNELVLPLPSIIAGMTRSARPSRMDYAWNSDSITNSASALQMLATVKTRKWTKVYVRIGSMLIPKWKPQTDEVNTSLQQLQSLIKADKKKVARRQSVRNKSQRVVSYNEDEN